ncbi:MAG: response regulator transcription factor [Pseudomonadales bacterium]
MDPNQVNEAAQHIVLIDDDNELTEMMATFLGREDFKVSTCSSIATAKTFLAESQADLLLLDIMLPGESGLDLLRQLRTEGNTIAILLLTARGDEGDRILGLELGADDYLAKPFNPRELLARVRAVLRRSLPANDDALRAGDVVLNVTTRQATVAGNTVTMTGAEFGLLHCLLSQPGKLLTRAELSQSALGRELQLYDRSIDTHVSNLRRKIGDSVEISAIRGSGYLLVPGKS